MSAVRWFLRRLLRRALEGRPLDPAAPDRGRFSRRDIDEVAQWTFYGFDELVGFADLGQLERPDNRMNVRLAALTASLYRTLLDVGVPPSHAADLVADAGWRLYEMGTRPLIVAARMRCRDPQQRVNFVLRLLLRFPFSAPGRPGYEVDVSETATAMYTTWTWCPPEAFVRQLIARDGDRGDLEAFRRSWCSYDWALNDLLAGGHGAYSRPHTMSHGDKECDMRWSTHALGSAGDTKVGIRPLRRGTGSPSTDVFRFRTGKPVDVLPD